jgi:hypothetical protein
MRGSAARSVPSKEVQKCFFFARTRARMLSNLAKTCTWPANYFNISHADAAMKQTIHDILKFFREEVAGDK